MYSVFVVQAPNVYEVDSMGLGVFPKYNPELIKKYGYKQLEAKNRYLMNNAIAGSATTASPKAGGSPPAYTSILSFIKQNGYDNKEALRTQKNSCYSDLISAFAGLTQAMAHSIVDSLMGGNFTQEEYTKIITSTGNKKQDQKINKEKDVATEKLDKYTQRLFNWYCENGNFYSGDITVLGNPAYRVGAIVLYEDFEQDTTWEFYVESVQHDFDFTQGYLTTIGVTRGLPDYGQMRFKNLWGQSSDFKGGYLGEMSLKDLLTATQAVTGSSGASSSGGSSADWSNAEGGATAMKALSTATDMTKRDSIYQMGAGRDGGDPFLDSPIFADCSSFVWWCYYMSNVYLKGGKTSMTTYTIAQDQQLTIISNRGDSKTAVRGKLRLGDLIWFDTYTADGHIGIYSGGGNFISCQDKYGISTDTMASGYWWQHFNGHVMRFEN
jgi:cell wall-associated NlpC family hydrolase